jgi:hypothetical protein
LLELVREIGRRLSGQRRVARAHAFALVPVALRAGGQAACGIAGVIQCERGDFLIAPHLARQQGVVGGHRTALGMPQPCGNPRHLRMLPPPVCIGDKLAFEVARVQPGQSRRADAVALGVDPVAGEAGVLRPGPGTRQCNQFAGGGKAVGRGVVHHGAAAKAQGSGKGGQGAHACSTASTARWFRMALAAALLLPATACKGEPEDRREMPLADAARGREAAMRAGCGACHAIPGIGWPQGALGPPLDNLAGRGLIGGMLPNRPDVLAAYIRDAPALVPGSGMPAMPVSAAEARDIAAYLYQAGAN